MTNDELALFLSVKDSSMTKKIGKLVLFVPVFLLLCGMDACDKNPARTGVKMDDSKTELPQTEAEWKERLTDKQYDVLRKKGTERAFTGQYDKHYEPGVYKCAGCGDLLFTSESKYNSGCGWPAFSAPADQKAVDESRDSTLGMVRTEITCSKCGGHLGHVFNDGPAPTGLRYCINSAALDFEENDEE